MRVRYRIFQLFTMSACLIYQLCELVVAVMVVMLSVVFIGIFGSSRSRISPPGAGPQPLILGQKPIIWQDFIKKTTWKWKKLDREGETLVPSPFAMSNLCTKYVFYLWNKTASCQNDGKGIFLDTWCCNVAIFFCFLVVNDGPSEEPHHVVSVYLPNPENFSENISSFYSGGLGSVYTEVLRIALVVAMQNKVFQRDAYWPPK